MSKMFYRHLWASAVLPLHRNHTNQSVAKTSILPVYNSSKWAQVQPSYPTRASNFFAKIFENIINNCGLQFLCCLTFGIKFLVTFRRTFCIGIYCKCLHECIHKLGKLVIILPQIFFDTTEMMTLANIFTSHMLSKPCFFFPFHISRNLRAIFYELQIIRKCILWGCFNLILSHDSSKVI